MIIGQAGPAIDPITAWTALGAVATAATFVVLTATLVFAKRAATFAGEQVRTAKEISKTTLSNDVLNADWTNRGIQAVNALLGDSGSMLAARERVAAAARNRSPKDEQVAAVSATVGAYAYLAMLYRRGVVDRELFIEAAAYHVAIAMYMIEPLFRSYIAIGIYDDSILDFARDCVREFLRRPDAQIPYGFMREWNL